MANECASCLSVPHASNISYTRLWGLAGTFFAIPYFAQKIEGNPLLRWDKYMLVVLPNVVGGACFWVGGYMEMVVNDAEYLKPRWSDPVW